jgi:HEAT repeat protein
MECDVRFREDTVRGYQENLSLSDGISWPTWGDAMRILFERQSVSLLALVATVCLLSPGSVLGQSKIDPARMAEIRDQDMRESVKMLYALDPWLRCEGLRKLHEIAPKCIPALPWIIEALGDDAWEGDWDPSSRVFEVAQFVLSKLGAASEESLLDSLDSPSDRIRERAAGLLGEFGCRKAIPRLLRIVEDEKFQEVWGTASALGKLKVKAAVPALCQRLLRDEPETLLAAVYALAEIADPKAVPALINHVRRHAGGDSAKAAVATLYRIDGIGFAGAIELLNDRDHRIRESATRGLASIRDKRLVLPLLARLEDEDRFVQDAAAFALTWIVDLEGVAPVERAFARKTAAPEVRRTALVVLEKHHPDPMPFILESLADQDVEGDVQRAAVDFLVDNPARQAADALVWAMRHSTKNDVRAHAARALGCLGDKEFVEPLVETLSDATSLARAAAARALGKIRDARAITPLIERLGDSGWDTRQAAAFALVKFDDPRIVPALIQMAKAPDESDRCAAVLALGQVHQSTVVVTLIEKLRDEDDSVRGASRRVLVSRTEPEIEAMLKLEIAEGNESSRVLAEKIVAERATLRSRQND